MKELPFTDRLQLPQSDARRRRVQDSQRRCLHGKHTAEAARRTSPSWPAVPRWQQCPQGGATFCTSERRRQLHPLSSKARPGASLEGQVSGPKAASAGVRLGA